MLARCRLFHKLDDQALRQVFDAGSLQVLAKSKHLFRAGDRCSDVYVILSGKIGISTTGVSGREVGFREHRAGDAFGELAAIDGQPRSASAKASVPTQLFKIPAGSFRGLLESHPSVAREVLNSLARLVRLLSERIAESGALAAVRIVAGLVQMAEEAAPSPTSVQAKFVPAPTDEQLAARHDTHREAVNRVIGDLKRRRLIARSRAELAVLDLPGLRRHLDGLRR